MHATTRPVEPTRADDRAHVHAQVETRDGLVQGACVDGVYVFRGIPYAAPPFGENRFRAPQPPQPWSGVRETLTWGVAPPAVPYPPPFDVLIPEGVEAGEDCLNLCVWSRELGAAKQPVMVWMAGGQFEHGAGAIPAYDGGRFARDGVVCVTINYRAGADGFLHLDDTVSNRGLLDQVAALEWVRDNIAGFGGDPDDVTVFGQSAGAISIAILLTMPRARGLFRRAIVQSGGAHPVMSAAGAGHVTRCLAEMLGVVPTRAALAAVPVERFLGAQVELEDRLGAEPDPARWGEEAAMSHMAWQPVIDGDTIARRPLDLMLSGTAWGADVDLLVGSNTDEWRFFVVPNGMIDWIPQDGPADAAAVYGLPVEPTLAGYRASRPDASAGDLVAAILGDWYVRLPAMRLADAHAEHAGTAKTYAYEFAWRSPRFGGRLGACHALEIPFVFDSLGADTVPLWGPAPPQALADAMHAAWVAFATTGDCGWPRYDLRRRATMRFDTTSSLVDDPLSRERELWSRGR